MVCKQKGALHCAKISGNFGPKCKWTVWPRQKVSGQSGPPPEVGFLLFTWANWSLHCLDKWYAEFRTGKFHPGITFTICTNQFHLPKNGRKLPEPVSKMALKKWNRNFHFGIFHPEKQDCTFSDVPLLLEIFLWNDPKSCVLYFPCLTGFSGI